MRDQLLVTSIAGRRVAFPTGKIQSVIELDRVERVPRSPPGIAGLTALRSRVLTVVDCARIIEPDFATTAGDDGGYAVVIEIDDSGYALMVEDVEDVTAAQGGLADPRADLGAGWSDYVRGVAETPLGALVVIDPAHIVRGALQSAAKAA